jgi:phage-related protein
MLPLKFVGSARRDFLAMSEQAFGDAGFQLWKVQCGEEPDDWKPMPSVGLGVKEIRIWCEGGTYRIIYVVKSAFGVFVLHAFAKKSQATLKRDIELARKRLKEL